MEWTQFTLLIVALTGLFIWNRAESRSDARNAQNLILAIHDEMKDFHGRLCALEEKNRKQK